MLESKCQFAGLEGAFVCVWQTWIEKFSGTSTILPLSQDRGSPWVRGMMGFAKQPAETLTPPPPPRLQTHLSINQGQWQDWALEGAGPCEPCGLLDTENTEM